MIAMREALRALVVDEDNLIAQHHAFLLEEAGVSVRIANHPSEALEIILSFDPDMVVLDYHLPEMNGSELAARIREIEGGELIGILLVTADHNKDIIEKALEKGVTSILMKPVDQALFAVHCLAITESSRKIREAEKRLRTIVTEQHFQEQALNQHAIVSMADREGTITYVNDKFCEISGYGKEDLLGNNHRILKSGKHPPEFYSEMWKTISGGKTWHGVVCNRRRDGSFYWVESTITPFIGPDGKPYKYVSIRTDITHLKDLVDQVRLQANVISVTMDGILIADARQPDLPIVYANPAFSSMTGYRLKEILGKNCRFLNAGDTEQEGIDQMRSAITHAEEVQVVVRNYRKDGSMFWNEIHLSPVFNEDSELTHYVAIEQDVTERIESEMELRKAKEEAERANQAKSVFLSSMSHELRTPMNAILGFSQLMESDQDLSEMNKDNVREILKAGHHLLELIDDVLDLAKIESGKLLLSLEPVELLPVIDECINLVGTLAAKRNVRISHEGCNGVVVRADRVRLKQALVNFMSNAVKYNRKEGSVRVSASASGVDRVRIAVIDSGNGIPENLMPELFKPFNRLGAEHSGVEGTGIGLSITKRIAEMMGGEVGAQSESGVGSRFWIDLPRDSQIGQAIQDNAMSAASLSPHEIGAARTILYIEDNPSNIKLVAQILRRLDNVCLRTAHTPEIGISIAESHMPDLILLDINLPGMDGYQALSILKSIEALKDRPVIAVTANAMPRDIERGKAAGFDEYLTKPIDVKMLLDTVRRFLYADDEEKT